MQFTIKYYDYEIDDLIHFCCPEQALASGFCIFHDKDYLQDKTNNEHKRKVLDRLKYKVNHAISNNEPLLCIGFYLPDFSLSDLSISKKFTIPVYFGESRFFGKGFFIVDKFQRTASSIEPSLPSQPSPLSDFEEFKAIYGLGNRQRFRLVGIESRKTGLMDIYKFILLQRRRYKAAYTIAEQNML